MIKHRSPIKTIKTRIIELEATSSSSTPKEPLRLIENDDGTMILAIDTASVENLGAVKLCDTLDSDSTTEAATARALKEVHESSVGGSLTIRTIDTEAPLEGGGKLDKDLTLSVADGTVDEKGIVQLSVDIESTSDSLAATISAVNKVMGKIPDISGLVPESRAVAVEAPLQGGRTLEDDIVLTIDPATEESSGVVQLYNDVDSGSAVMAATANAVKKVYDSIPKESDTNKITVKSLIIESEDGQNVAAIAFDDNGALKVNYGNRARTLISRPR